MDTRIGRLHVPVAWIGMSSMLVVVTLVPILDRVVYPALTDRGIHIPASWRIVFGMAMGFVSVLFGRCIYHYFSVFAVLLRNKTHRRQRNRKHSLVKLRKTAETFSGILKQFLFVGHSSEYEPQKQT